MNTITRFFLVAIVISALMLPVAAHDVRGIKATSTHYAAQYDDPYSDFRNARYSNSGLLNERDEIKLGTQLHREVTKKRPSSRAVMDARSCVARSSDMGRA